MNVLISPAAAADLDAIWAWNANHISVPYADEYDAFLRDEIFRQLERSLPGSPIQGSLLRFITLKSKGRGHFHLAVFFPGESVHFVARVFHSAQNWRAYTKSR